MLEINLFIVFLIKLPKLIYDSCLNVSFAQPLLIKVIYKLSDRLLWLI